MGTSVLDSSYKERIQTDRTNEHKQSLSASDYHPALAIGVADGSCQTTNTLRHTRKGGIVVCGLYV